MDQERSDSTEKMEEIMLPGFRFHPTDEELVGFYLKRKVQQRPLSIELIKQLDIYKYDPWDLPKMATTGEKEWYFYCPRDRKYRNSARPNRVTGAGFWKATGTDRPIYSSEGSKCIGLKKSLVFYKGRAAKGVKTDWMMHEFRLPSLTDSAAPKRFIDKSIPANEAWAICRIFKKKNSTPQRALSHSWVSPIPEASSTSDMANKSNNGSDNTRVSSETMSFTTKNSSTNQFNHNIFPDMQQTFPSLADFSCFNKSINQMGSGGKPSPPQQLPMSAGDLTGLVFAPLETSGPAKNTIDVTSMLLNMSSSMLGGDQSGFSMSPPHHHEMHGEIQGDEQWETNSLMRSIGVELPYNFPVVSMGDAYWKPPNLVWDSSSCPSEMSTAFSTTKCYT